MIDMHSHVLPGLDDGAPDMETSLEMARVAVADGVEQIVATPHVNSEFGAEPAIFAQRTGALNGALAREEIPFAVLPGAEIAISRLPEMDDDALRGLTLGGGPALLVECPFTRPVAFLEDLLFDLQLRGFQVVLAHPERCPLFHADQDRLANLVDRGVMCSVTAASLHGGFGRRVQQVTAALFQKGLVHNVASDAHDPVNRAPVLRAAFEKAEALMPGISAQRAWFTEAAPAAILAGDPLPPRPDPPAPPAAPERPSLLGRLRRPR